MRKTDVSRPKGRRACPDAGTVTAVPGEREAAGGKLYTDLVCSSCMQRNADQRQKLPLNISGSDDAPGAGRLLHILAPLFHDIRFVCFSVMEKEILKDTFSCVRASADNGEIFLLHKILLKETLKRGTGFG